MAANEILLLFTLTFKFQPFPIERFSTLAYESAHFKHKYLLRLGIQYFYSYLYDEAISILENDFIIEMNARALSVIEDIPGTI